MVMELLNIVIEFVVDLMVKQYYYKLVKIVKDCVVVAVLVLVIVVLFVVSYLILLFLLEMFIFVIDSYKLSCLLFFI